MTHDPLLDRICRDLTEAGAHTVLLYGSRADGSATESSDYDVAAFAPVERVVRDTRVMDGHFLDVFTHPDEALSRPTVELLTLRGSRILRQRNDDATRFLAGLDALYQAGPERLTADEIRARDVWARKMALRARRGDVEGDYRRVWLLTAVLEDYFVTREMWFEGPKKALQWLRAHDHALYEAFEAALKPDAPFTVIDALVDRATRRAAASEWTAA
jgi:hypothetical protein